MPLETQTWTVDEALNDLRERIEDIGDDLRDLQAGTDRYQALVERADSLEYRRNGLIWMRDEAGWGGFEVEFGAISAGEKAKMHREADDKATDAEMSLWVVAAGSVDGPHVGDDLSDTFATLAADAHDGFVQWAEARINEVSAPGNANPVLRQYLQGTPNDKS